MFWIAINLGSVPDVSGGNANVITTLQFRNFLTGEVQMRSVNGNTPQDLLGISAGVIASLNTRDFALIAATAPGNIALASG